jgi:Family of unknown function (DUF5678)
VALIEQPGMSSTKREEGFSGLYPRRTLPQLVGSVVISLSHNGGTMTNPLQKEFEFYLDHQDEMVEKYEGKYIVIKGEEVLSAYDNELAAITETQKSYPLGTFLVQLVTRGPDAYTQTFHSRVVFT